MRRRVATVVDSDGDQVRPHRRAVSIEIDHDVRDHVLDAVEGIGGLAPVLDDP